MWIEHADETAQLALAAEALTRHARATTDATARARLLSLARAHREMISPSAWIAADELQVDQDFVGELVDDFKAAA